MFHKLYLRLRLASIYALVPAHARRRAVDSSLLVHTQTLFVEPTAAGQAQRNVLKSEGLRRSTSCSASSDAKCSLYLAVRVRAREQANTASLASNYALPLLDRAGRVGRLQHRARGPFGRRCARGVELHPRQRFWLTWGQGCGPARAGEAAGDHSAGRHPVRAGGGCPMELSSTAGGKKRLVLELWEKWVSRVTHKLSPMKS
ncbi:hypothetical protein B0H17DRAFT_1138973 [Mycena rosella]|uniref:Uncharacterized protein n=1 Tax=Mycena rosella TaxID=1033263 RepID=A0AAD7D592_MYCRO|nr:hypothetical protein B0H17DRAFT_1138973 [Mycena rosella]